jgi:hypothetical protein
MAGSLNGHSHVTQRSYPAPMKTYLPRAGA